MMREMLRELREAGSQGRGCVHCSVVETRGSTPQKAGAVMIVFEDGRQVGTLGGGCVEAEVRKQALAGLGDPSPRILSFTLDDDYGWDDGLICGGRMTFLAQPIPCREANSPGPGAYFERLAAQLDTGAGLVEAVVLDEERVGRPAGSRFLFDANGEPVAAFPDVAFPPELLDDVPCATERPRPYAKNGVAYLPVLARPRLLIVGAGHVGQAVAELAHQVDFDVWVLDDRESYASAERFPFAERRIVGDIGRSLKEFVSDANTYCLIVTRGHSHDEEALYHLAEKPARYVGLIGSKRKIRMIFDDLEKEGISPAALDRVYAPIGLDIGSQTVPEIAVSVVAQLVGHRNLGAEAFPPPAHGRSVACPG